jgi:anti-anti-sigma factor
MTRRLDCESHKLENHPITVIELSGQIDAPDSLNVVKEIVCGDAVENVAILMEKVKYINSRGCGELISLHKKVKDRGFKLYFVKPVAGVKRVMEHVGCTRILSVKESLDEVIEEVES